MESDTSRPSPTKTEERKLIKFSNYSLCVTLPKWVIKELKWNKGDVVKLVVDNKKGEILIRKDKTAKSLATKDSAKSGNQKKSNARW